MNEFTLDGQPADLETVARLALGNYGHFTTMAVQRRAVRGLGLHLERLVRDCDTLFGVALDSGRVRELVRNAVSADDPPTVVRVTVFDPAIGAVTPGGDAHPIVLVSTRPLPTARQSPLRVVTTPYVRELPQIKHTGLFGVTVRRREAVRAGYDDVVFVGADGCLSEGATWTLGCHDGERVIWPERDCLPGVTAALLDRAGVAHRFGDIRPDQLAGMAAVFAVSATTGVRVIGVVDGCPIPADARIIGELSRAYGGIEFEPLALVPGLSGK